MPKLTPLKLVRLTVFACVCAKQSARITRIRARSGTPIPLSRQLITDVGALSRAIADPGGSGGKPAGLEAPLATVAKDDPAAAVEPGAAAAPSAEELRAAAHRVSHDATRLELAARCLAESLLPSETGAATHTQSS
jgi:hypothetical protein